MHLALKLDTARIDLPTGLSLDLTLVFGTNVDTLHNNAILIWQNVDHLATFPFIFKAPADYLNSIAFANLDSHSNMLPN
jgi:hypothetical protein